MRQPWIQSGIWIWMIACCQPLVAAVPQFTDEGFRVPQPFAELPVPQILASNPDYKIEWWYLTGHLFAGQRRFGYQATFFRYALKPAADDLQAAFGLSQLHMTHMALVDEQDDRFYYQQRLDRNGWDAAASTRELQVRHGNTRLHMTDPQTQNLHLQGSVGNRVRWDLQLQPLKPLVRFGEDGTSRKGSSATARSYYLSYTRLHTSGTVVIGDREFSVEGLSWMDHEMASSQLDPDYRGWDWIAVQLDDGWELKAYILRDANDQPSDFSALIWIEPDGSLHYRSRDQFSWSKDNLWRSPHNAARYPIRPQIRTRHPVSGAPVLLRFEPVREDQELNFRGTVYWEGAGSVFDANDKRIGNAYLELVGYAGPIEGLR